MRPLLAHIYEPKRMSFPAWSQPKFNGVRALSQGGNFQSRDELPFSDGIFTHIARSLLEIADPTIVFDGELYVHGWPLQRIMSAVTPVRQHPTEDTLKIEYHIFDIVDFTLSFEERFIPWTRRVPSWPILWADTWQVNSLAECDACYAMHVNNGYEGSMLRLGDCPYTIPKQIA